MCSVGGTLSPELSLKLCDFCGLRLSNWERKKAAKAVPKKRKLRLSKSERLRRSRRMKAYWAERRKKQATKS
jgi:hypothetical protein